MIDHPTSTAGFGVYLHWPFCAAKCPYCDFNSHVRHSKPDEAAYVAAYAQRTGRTSLPDFDYYVIYNMFRMAAILQGIMGRVRDGTAASTEAERMGRLARPVAEAGWAEVERLGLA